MSIYSKITRHGQITLPSAVRKQLGVEEGDIIEIAVVDEVATLVPKKLVDKSQAYFWAGEWQAGEREAETDIRSGRIRVYKSAKELIKDLD